MTTLTQKIKSKAKELGFELVGMTTADPLVEKEKLTEWLSRKYHGSMRYMEKDIERKTNPESILPGAKSVVCAGLLYRTQILEEPPPLSGRISCYALGEDYHRVLERKLRSLLEYILEECPGAHGKIYVDTGPLMDKALARRAGLGWMGKHTNLIHPELGSYFFLGEIILDVALEEDNPIEDLCGGCTACIEACPTGAIAEPYVLDARRCISYLTIEHKGNVDESLAPLMGNWLFGCDICQDVCPWNRQSSETKEAAFFSRNGAFINVHEALRMTESGFSEKFKNSAVKRAKLSGLQRNARIVMENLVKVKCQTGDRQ